MNKKGFTLLEILVVISIIGILIAIGLAAFSTAQIKTRDARRRADMKAVQNAFEQYSAENGGYVANCSTMAAEQFSSGALPTDPKSGMSYTFTCSITAYCACADIEGDDGNSDVTDCSGFTQSGGDYYCVKNLQ